MNGLEFALFYAERLGFSVIPIKHKDKKPLIKWQQFQETPATPEQIREWWAKWPNANVGIVTGAVSNLVVLDEDGPEGRAQIEANGGCDGAVVQTSKGRHFYFQHPGFVVRNFARKLPGLDLRGDGGYVAAPPSVHESGVLYDWTTDPIRIDEVPEWLLEHLKEEPKSSPLQLLPAVNREHLNGAASSPDQARRFIEGCFRKELEKIAAVPDGEKHSQCLRSATYLAGYIATGQTSAEEIHDRLFVVIEPRAKDKKNASDTIRDGIKYGEAKPLEIPPLPPKRTLRGPTARSYIETGAEPDGETEGDTEDAPPLADGKDDNPYGIQDGRIVFSMKKNNTTGHDAFFNIVADFAAHITEEIMAEDGEATYHIKGRTPKNSIFNVEIGAKKFNNPQGLSSELSAAAGAQFPVRAGMEKHLPTAVKKLTDASFQRGYRFDRTGWAEVEGNKTFLMPGNEPPHTTIQLKRKLPYEMNRTADLQIGLEAFESLIRAQVVPMTTVAATFAFQAPLAALCGWQNERYCMFISGRSGSLKSSWTQALMCLYGHNFLSDEYIIKWGEGATRTAIMIYASFAQDMPLLLDNYKPNTGRGANDFVNIIQNIVEGGDRDRGTREGGLNEGRIVGTWPLATGEDVPTSDAASLARILVVPFAAYSEGNSALLKRAQNNARHLNAVGAAWLDWLLTPEGTAAAERAKADYDEHRTKWGVYLRNQQPDMVNPLRVASNIASNALTWRVMGECPALQPIIKEYSRQHDEGIRLIADSMASYTFESMEATRYLSALRELLATDRCVIINRTDPIRPEERDRVVGYYGTSDEAEDFFLFPDAARKAVLSHLGPDGLNHLTDVTLRRQLHSLGAIGSFTDTQLLKVVKVNGKTMRLLHLTGAALQAKGGEIE